MKEEERRMLLFPEFGPKKDFRGTVSMKTVSPHLRSIVPNVQRPDVRTDGRDGGEGRGRGKEREEKGKSG
jgi:hypothetical protein